MSYLEIYNENIRDLLNPGSGHLDLRDDSKGKNIQVAGLSEVATKNTEEVRKFVKQKKIKVTKETFFYGPICGTLYWPPSIVYISQNNVHSIG